MFLINLNAEIVACILSFRKLRHEPNLENTSKKTNIMPLTESIMLFYREAFPMSYHALSVCGLRSNLEQ